MKTWFLAVILSAVLHRSDGYNYLVWSPLFARSHNNFLSTIAEIVAQAGHNVTFLAPIIDESMRDDPEKLLQYTRDVLKPEASQQVSRMNEALLQGDYTSLWVEKSDVFTFAKMCAAHLTIFAHSCESVVVDKKLMETLKKKNFDVILTEAISECPFAVRDILKIPTLVLTDSFPEYDTVANLIGEPILPSYVPGFFSTQRDKMNVLQRGINALETWFGEQMVQDPNVPKMVKEKLNIEVRLSREVIPEAAFVLSNSNPFLNFPRPTLHKTVQIGGATINLTELRSEKLSKEWEEVVSRRSKNVLVSFGTMVFSSAMPNDMRTTILNVFSSMPNVTFIWKYEDDDVAWAEKTSNVHFSKWVPQKALLASRKLSAFVTHAGLGSTNELAYLGVPAVTVPIFADQFRNAYMLERHGGSIVLEKSDLFDEDLVKKAIHDVVYDQSYTENAKKLAEVLERQPIPPKELALRYLEFAARFGELKSQDPHGRHLNFFEYHLIDLFFYSLFGSVFVAYLVYKCAIFLRNLIKKKPKIQKFD
ncbi:unnamed protein product [Caenorhabditis auriculariae]|uniref:UDP-glucuronosyltransferase n=1 Tax=Caenorhabditis auriculariae TaxID=2777116 RepID=A0A8S1HX18_9PELO|nr:unnamed protein product [Caenorhabditis auriculariae]